MKNFKNKLRLLNNIVLLRLSVILIVPEGFCLSIEKQLGTNENIDVTADPGYKLLPSLKKCGFNSLNDRAKRVVGGRPSAIKEFPWMAQLYFTNATTGDTSINCGGTIITKDVILTAAHCLSRIGTGMSFMTVAFGQSDRSKIKFCKSEWETEKDEKCSTQFSRRVKKFIIHEGYSEGNLENDIGLVFLHKPLRFSSRVRPICLPYSSELLQDWKSTKLRVVGWGLMSKLDETPQVLATNLMSVDVHVRERSYCDQFHTRQYGKLDGSRFCAGGESGSGSCSGDSGGPLLKRLPVPHLEGEERDFQFGIVSAGVPNSCGYTGLPLVYINVLHYMPWILENLAKNYSSDSTESFPMDELASSEDGSGSVEKIADQNQTPYANELSTGLNIDVLSHPNLSKLPKLSECGNIPSPTKSKNPDSEDSDDFEELVDIDYDDEQRKRKRKHLNLKRMIGGRVASLGWFPFFAQIYERDVMTGELELRCGGMIISKTLILTAATCVSNLPSPWALDSIRVGNYNRNKTEECLDSECFSANPYSIKDIIVHEGFTKFAHQNDLALVRIAGKLEWSRLVQPICLPTTEAILDELKDFVMIAAGYGLVTEADENDNVEGVNKPRPSNIPKYIEVNLKPRWHCERIYQRFIGRLDRSRFCGGGKEPDEGECNGDMGGPLLKPISMEGNTKGKTINKYYQFGIISFNECGKEGMFTVYTNLIYHLPWLLDHI